MTDFLAFRQWQSRFFFSKLLTKQGGGGEFGATGLSQLSFFFYYLSAVSTGRKYQPARLFLMSVDVSKCTEWGNRNACNDIDRVVEFGKMHVPHGLPQAVSNLNV